MNQLPIHNGFKGIQKAMTSSIMHGIILSIKENIRSIDRATQALENVPKVHRPNKEENQTNPRQRRVLKFLEFWEIVAGATVCIPRNQIFVGV